MQKIFYFLTLLLFLHIADSQAIWQKSICASQISEIGMYLSETANALSTEQKLPNPFSAYFDNAINRLQEIKAQCPY